VSGLVANRRRSGPRNIELESLAILCIRESGSGAAKAELRLA
jgi:hypothetical protein